MWPGWLSPVPKVGRRTLGDSLCAKVRVLLLVSGSTSDVCKSPMAECVRVSLTSAGTGFSVGGSEVAELRAGMQAAGRACGCAQRPGPGGTKHHMCFNLRGLCSGAWYRMPNAPTSVLSQTKVVCVLCGTAVLCFCSVSDVRLRHEMWCGGSGWQKGCFSLQTLDWRGQCRLEARLNGAPSNLSW